MPAEGAATKARLDEHLLAYLGAYQDFLTVQVELEACVRDGHIGLAHARRELSRTRNTSSSQVSPMQFPSEFEAVLRVQADAEAPPSDIATLSAVTRDTTAAAPAPAESVAGAPSADAAAQKAAKELRAHEELAQLGVDHGLKKEIVEAIMDDKAIGVACGDRIVVEGEGALELRSHISTASNGLASLNASIFQAAVADARPAVKPPQRPAADRDPLRWFAVLPPLSLRKAQKSFRRVAESSIQLANARQRMEHHRRLYEELCITSGLEHLLHLVDGLSTEPCDEALD